MLDRRPFGTTVLALAALVSSSARAQTGSTPVVEQPGAQAPPIDVPAPPLNYEEPVRGQPQPGSYTPPGYPSQAYPVYAPPGGSTAPPAAYPQAPYPPQGYPPQPGYPAQPGYSPQAGYPLQPSAWAPAPPVLPRNRNGFTLELGVGFGLVWVPKTSYTQSGLYGLNLSLGTFLNPRLVIAFRISGVTFFTADGSAPIGSALGVLQYFPTDALMVSAGLGLMLPELSFAGLSSSAALGLNLRAGYSVVDWRAGAIRLVLEATGAMFSGTLVVTGGFGAEYQLY